jgi:UDP-glucose 4-epimerase
MQIHLLGSSGFIGSQFHRYFSESGYNVKGYSSADCNLLSKESIRNSLDLHPEDVVIMASCINKRKENSLNSLIRNISMADNISQFIKENSVAQFIFLSTIDVYGTHPQIPIKETQLPNPEDYYAISKLSSEFVIKSVCSDKKIPCLILRLPGIYGKGDGEKSKSTINILVEAAKKGEVTIFGEGVDIRDFVHVKDLYKLVTEAIADETSTTLNVATGEPYSIKELVEIIGEFFPIKINKKQGNKLSGFLFDTSLLNKIFPNMKFMKIRESLDLYIKECEG